jgi:hypothetical protein
MFELELYSAATHKGVVEQYSSQSSIANPGYSRLPNGLLLQWGNTTVNSSVGSVTFPAAFSSVYSMQLTPTVSTVGNTLPAVTSLSTTVAQLRSANATSSTVYWLAIGT